MASLIKTTFVVIHIELYDKYVIFETDKDMTTEVRYTLLYRTGVEQSVIKFSTYQDAKKYIQQTLSAKEYGAIYLTYLSYNMSPTKKNLNDIIVFAVDDKLPLEYVYHINDSEEEEI